MGAPCDRPDQLGGQAGAVLVELSGLAAVIRFTVIVLPLTAPLTCTAPPTGNCSFLDQVQHDPAVPKLCSPVMDRLGTSKPQATSELLGDHGEMTRGP